jgi:hypothetical protein
MLATSVALPPLSRMRSSTRTDHTSFPARTQSASVSTQRERTICAARSGRVRGPGRRGPVNGRGQDETLAVRAVKALAAGTDRAHQRLPRLLQRLGERAARLDGRVRHRDGDHVEVHHPLIRLVGVRGNELRHNLPSSRAEACIRPARRGGAASASRGAGPGGAYERHLREHCGLSQLRLHNTLRYHCDAQPTDLFQVTSVRPPSLPRGLVHQSLPRPRRGEPQPRSLGPRRVPGYQGSRRA